MDQARTKLDNVKAAILDGIRTPTTRVMLEEWEGRVDRLEADLAVTIKAQGNVTLHPATIEGYLQDLRGTLATDTDHARLLLQRLVGKITLRREANRLVAEIGGNLPGLIDLEDYGKSGAGGVFLFRRPFTVSGSTTSRHRTCVGSACRNHPKERRKGDS